MFECSLREKIRKMEDIEQISFIFQAFFFGDNKSINDMHKTTEFDAMK
jgi:hypothetical protein